MNHSSFMDSVFNSQYYGDNNYYKCAHYNTTRMHILNTISNCLEGIYEYPQQL